MLLDSIDRNLPDNYEIVMQTYVLIGNSYDLQGDFDLGVLYLSECLDFCRIDDAKYKAILHHRLAALYNCLYDRVKAKEHIHDAFDNYELLDNEIGIANCYNILGLIHVNEDHNSKADSVFHLALDIYRKHELEKSIAVVLNNMSMYNENPPEKISHLKEAIATNRRYNRIWSLAENYNNLGLQYFYNKQYNMALQAFDTAYTYAIATDAKEIVSDNYKYKSWMYDSLGVYDKAYYYSVEGGKIEKNIQSEANIRNIERMIAKSTLEKKRNQIRMLNEQNKTKVLYNTLFYFVFGLILLVIALYALYKRQKLKQISEIYRTKLELQESESQLLAVKLEQEQMEKNEMESQLDTSVRDLTTFSEYIKSRTDLFDKIKQQIKATYQSDREGMVKELKKIIVMINKYLKSDDNQVMIAKQIDQYSDEFLNRLEELHPGMSKTDKKLASYLRLGMSTKDICLITGSNLKAVNMARYRLRKHMGLDGETSTIEYLQSIV